MTKQALHKVEQFVKVALSEIAELKAQLHELKEIAEQNETNIKSHYEHVINDLNH